MRRALLGLLLLLAASIPASSGMLVNSYAFESRAFNASYLQQELGDSVAGNVATWTGVNFGASHSTRIIYVAVHTRITTGATISSATIAGVAATLHIQNSVAFVGADEVTGIFSAVVPTGASGDVTVTFSAAPTDPGTSQRLYLGVYRVINQTGGLDDTDSTTGGSTVTGTRTLNPTVVGGAMIAAITGAAGASASTTWTNAIEQYDNAFAGHGSSFCTGALLTSLAGTTQAYSATFTNSSSFGILGVSFH